MNSLQEVYLDNNPFASWEIPETIKEATSLKNLSLVNCNLAANTFWGPIPDLSGLQSLRLFNVRENQLTGLVPPSFTGLKSLTVVNLTNNCFQGPTPLFDNSLAWDYLFWNFAKLTSLETINLSNNQLTGSIPTELTTLPRLRTLDVSNNDIHGDVPKFSASVTVLTTGNVNIGPVSPTGWKSFRNRI
ncbi:BnaCnng44290D [Brassica napus]|uniref:BnaCnng44290D protein n=1 Tax=Brassica napus TaxID=3708 RepID=A0A078JGM0_BRANA|nr:BnaCnng44290D [Brassica napus]